FVMELVAEYLRLLPNLYAKYPDLPTSLTDQHRRGIGQILSRIGQTGRFKDYSEHNAVNRLADGLKGSSPYALLPDAFFIERQNFRFQRLEGLFNSLGVSNAGPFIENHPDIVAFLTKERGEGTSARKELEDFIQYRNEAAHKKVESILSNEETTKKARFVALL